MAEDPELRRLRDQVRNLEAQVAFARRGALGGGGTGGAGCVIAMVALVGLVGAAGALAFIVMRSDASRSYEAPRAEAEARARAVAEQRAAMCDAQIARLQAELAARAAAPVAPPDVVRTSVYGAHVTATSGASHVHVGDACRLDITSHSEAGRLCRVFVECGDRRVYGSVGYGYLPCQVTPDQGVVHAEDDNPTSDGGDPRITIDRITNTATVSDDGPAWSITLAMDAVPE